MSEDGPSTSGAPPQAGMLVVEVVRRGGAWNESGIGDATVELATFAAFTNASAPAPSRCSVTVLLTDNAEMQELNRKWRGKDAPTNVLSFPAGNGPADGALGDIVIAIETAHAEAAAAGISLNDHVSHLVVHGVLHLLGFDHLEDAEARRMENAERQALASIGIDDPYRHPDEVRLADKASLADEPRAETTQ